jgi:DNA polymerase III delta subunit
VSSQREPLLPAYAIWGEDRAKIERTVARLIARVAEEGGLPPERFRAAETGADAVVAACEVLALGGPRLVVVDGADDWKARDIPPLLEYLERPNPGTCLALVSSGPVAQKVGDAIGRVGRILQSGPDPKAKRGERAKWFLEHAKAEVGRVGGRIEAAAARRLVERVMVDRTDARKLGITAMEISREAEKLAAYAGDEPITGAMVELLVPRHPDARSYELADAIAAGDPRRAFNLLQDLATGDEPAPPIVIAAALARHFRVVAEAQALGPGATPDELTQATGVQGYPARKAVEQAQALPPGPAGAAVDRLAALELDLRVSAMAQLGRTRDDGARLVLELATRDLLALARGKAPARVTVNTPENGPSIGLSRSPVGG